MEVGPLAAYSLALGLGIQEAPPARQLYKNCDMDCIPALNVSCFENALS